MTVNSATPAAANSDGSRLSTNLVNVPTTWTANNTEMPIHGNMQHVSWYSAITEGLVVPIPLHTILLLCPWWWVGLFGPDWLPYVCLRAPSRAAGATHVAMQLMLMNNEFNWFYKSAV